MKRWLALTLMLLLAAGPASAEATEWIGIAENALLPDATLVSSEYPASITTGKQLYDAESMLTALLDEGYYADGNDSYRSAKGEQPWEYRRVTIDEYDNSFNYYNPWIHGERGGEYEAPRMTAIPEENIETCRSLLKYVVPEKWTENVNFSRWIADRWDYADRWMTAEEYESFCKEHKSQYFTFDHLTDHGLPVWADRVYANIGVDGLASLSVNWREITESEEMISPMPLDEALKMANSTRSAKCTLLYAGLVYSNWLTNDDTHNLCWFLMTDSGRYMVDCVLNKHLCDTYEY